MYTRQFVSETSPSFTQFTAPIPVKKTNENIVTIQPQIQDQMTNSQHSNQIDGVADSVEGYMEKFNITNHMKEMTQQQIEYYFSPVNLPTDTQLRAKIDQDGFFSAMELASFPKVASLTTSLDQNRRIRFVMLLCLQSPQMEVDESLYRVKSIDHSLFQTDSLIIRNVVSGTTEEEIKNLFPTPLYPLCSSCYPLNNPLSGDKTTMEWVLVFSSTEDAMRTYQLMTKRAIVYSEKSLFVRFKLKDLPPSAEPPSSYYEHSISSSRPESQHDWSYSVETPMQHQSITLLPQQLDSNINNNLQQLHLQQPQYIYQTPLALASGQQAFTLATQNTQPQQLRQSIITHTNPQATPAAAPNIQIVPQNFVLQNGGYFIPPYVYDGNGNFVQFPFSQPVLYDLSRLTNLQVPMKFRHPTLIVGQPQTTILQQQQQQQHQYQHQVYNNNNNNSNNNASQISQHATISMISTNNNTQLQQQHSNNSSYNASRQSRRDTDRRQNPRYNNNNNNNNRNFNNNNNSGNTFHQPSFQAQQQQQVPQQQQQNNFLQQPPPQIHNQSYVFSNIATHFQQQQPQQHPQHQQIAVANKYHLVAISRPSDVTIDNATNSNTDDDAKTPNQNLPSNNNATAEVNASNSSNNTNNNTNANSNNNANSGNNRYHNTQQHQQQNRPHYNNSNNTQSSNNQRNTTSHNQQQQNANANNSNNSNNNANSNTLPRQHHQQQHVTYQHFHQFPGNHFPMPMQFNNNNSWKFQAGGQRYGGYNRGRRGGRMYEDNYNRNNPRGRAHQTQSNDFLENSTAFPPLATQAATTSDNNTSTTTSTSSSSTPHMTSDVTKSHDAPVPAVLNSTSSDPAISNADLNSADSDKKLSYAQIAQKGKEMQNSTCYEVLSAGDDGVDNDAGDGDENDDGGVGGDEDSIKKSTPNAVEEVEDSDAGKGEHQGQGGQQQQQHVYHHQHNNNYQRRAHYYQQQQQQQPPFRRGQWMPRVRNNNNNKERIQQQ